MSDLVVIGYDDMSTAYEARDEVERLSHDLVIQPDAVAVIVRDEEGKFRTNTNAHLVAGGAVWGSFWGLLFGLIFFVPLLGVAVGAGLGMLFGKIEDTGIDRTFQARVRELLAPGTSALFLIVEKVTPDRAVEALSKYGGTVLKTSLSAEAEARLQEELGGKVSAS
jgi:uncharacterized membrane protein